MILCCRSCATSNFGQRNHIPSLIYGSTLMGSQPENTYRLIGSYNPKGPARSLGSLQGSTWISDAQHRLTRRCAAHHKVVAVDRNEPRHPFPQSFQASKMYRRFC